MDLHVLKPFDLISFSSGTICPWHVMVLIDSNTWVYQEGQHTHTHKWLWRIYINKISFADRKKVRSKINKNKLKIRNALTSFWKEKSKKKKRLLKIPYHLYSILIHRSVSFGNFFFYMILIKFNVQSITMAG